MERRGRRREEVFLRNKPNSVLPGQPDPAFRFPDNLWKQSRFLALGSFPGDANRHGIWGLLLLALLLALASLGCGYRLANRAVPGLPPAIRTLAVPTFRNETFRFKIEQSLTAAVIREFLARTSYRVQSSGEGSDAILNGAVTAIYSSPIVFDPNSGRATEVLITVSLRVSLEKAGTHEILYEANDLVFREPYQVGSDPTTYFAEDQPALERLSRQVAASLVSTMIGNF